MLQKFAILKVVNTLLQVYEGIVDGRQSKPLRGIVPQTNLNMLTQLCMMLNAILTDYKVDNGDPSVSWNQTSQNCCWTAPDALCVTAPDMLCVTAHDVLCVTGPYVWCVTGPDVLCVTDPDVVCYCSRCVVCYCFRCGVLLLPICGVLLVPICGVLLHSMCGVLLLPMCCGWLTEYWFIALELQCQIFICQHRLCSLLSMLPAHA